MIYKIFINISLFLAVLSIWEIILGFNGDLLVFGNIKIRALFAFLNFISGILYLFFIKRIIRDSSDLNFYRSIILMSLIGFAWTSMGIIIFNNKYALADGQGLIASCSFLGIYFSLSRIPLSLKRLNFAFQTPLIILFALISILWLLQLSGNFDSKIVLDFINRYSSATFIGAGNELGRFFFLNTILLPFSAFIFSIQSHKLSDLKFWIFTTFYFVSMLAVGSRGIAISCILILFPTFISRFVITKLKGNILKAIFKITLPTILLITFVSLGFGESILGGSRFFDNSSSTTFDESDSVRYEQFIYLASSFFESPLWGQGFGYFNPNYLRSYDNPFSYELFFVALLVKIGIIGFLIYSCSLFLLFLSLISQARTISRSTKTFALISLMTTIFQASTNPFLDKQVGLLLLFGPFIYISCLSTSIASKSVHGD